MEEDQCIVCVTVQYGDWNPRCIVEGSVKKTCDNCSIPIYLSKSGQALLAEKPHTKLFCKNCTEQEIKAQKDKGEIVEVSILPESLNEFLDHLKKEK